MILDDFAGPGGWDEGLRMIGRTDVIGIEWDQMACETAMAAGHKRIRADVAQYPSEPFVGKLDAYIASPPCQAWSMAGKRKGELDRENCHRLADRMAEGDDSLEWTEWEDPRSHLVTQPIRRVRDLMPPVVALEEVPAVLGLWQHFARIFRSYGYSVWTGVLNSANYGVPQTRQRAILMASLTGLRHPHATHAKEPHQGLFGAMELPWVSMADALGWGFSDPSATISAGGATTGGWEPFANAAYRGRLRDLVVDRRTNSKDGRGGMAPTVPVSVTRPAPTLTSKAAAGQWVLRSRRDSDGWVEEFGERPNRPVTSSAPTISGECLRWGWAEGDEPATRNLTVEEAGVLQSFRADYPWQGNKGQQGQQVGNAVPPLLAAHVCQALGLGTLVSEVAA